MKIFRRSTLLVLTLVVMYFGIFNHTQPFVLLFFYLIGGALLLMWVFKPFIATIPIFQCLKNANYFKNYIIIKLLVFTYLNYLCVSGIKIEINMAVLMIAFLIVKIVIALFMEFLYLMIVLNEDASFPV
jgi:hypothetical protein